MSKRFLSGINVTGTATLNTVANAGLDTDKFLVLDAAGNIDYRTGAELKADIGADTVSRIQHEVKLGETMSIGTPVYVPIAQDSGTNMTVLKASNVSEGTSSKTMGLIASSGVTNDLVQVITEGLLAGLNTGSATKGDPVWLGANGVLIFGLVNKPVAPAHLVFIGIVTRAQTNNGEIFVKVQNGFEMGELHNYAEGSVQNNEVIVYESATSLYKPKSIPTILGYTPVPDTRTITINGTTYDLSANRSWTVSANQNARTEYEFTTDGTTASYSATYSINQVDVFYNGSKLASTEFTATNGTSVTLSFTPPSGQLVEVVAWETGGGVSSSRTLTINGTTYDLTANRTWTLTTTNIAEGTNLYYTDARVGSYLTANSYATQTYVTTAIANLVASAPAALDTLNELATALGNDANFSTTVSTALGNRLRVDIGTQGLTTTQQGYGRTNLGLGTAATANTGDFATATHNHNGTYVPTTRTITINGTAYDLSADRSWTIATSDATKLPLAGGTMTGNILFSNSGTTKRGIQGTSGDNDFWFIGGGATASNAGYLEISTGDDGQGAGTAEPIYVRQYGPGDPLTGTLYRSATLLDASGNTSFPGTITAPTFSGALSGTASNSSALSGINSVISAVVQSATISSIIAQDTNGSLYRYNLSALQSFGVITSGNIASQSVNYANYSGYSTSVELSSRIWFNGSGNHNVSMYESYGIVMNMVSHPWNVSILNGSFLTGTQASGGNYGIGNGYFTGDVTAYYSDRRLKHNLNKIDNALSKVMSLTGYTYQHNELGQELLNENPHKFHAGYVAQDVQSVLPEVVTIAPFDLYGYDEFGKGISKSGNNYLTIKYERILPLVTEAIKEQQIQIKELKAENDELRDILKRNNII